MRREDRPADIAGPGAFRLHANRCFDSLFEADKRHVDRLPNSAAQPRRAAAVKPLERLVDMRQIEETGPGQRGGRTPTLNLRTLGYVERASPPLTTPCLEWRSCWCVATGPARLLE